MAHREILKSFSGRHARLYAGHPRLFSSKGQISRMPAFTAESIGIAGSGAIATALPSRAGYAALFRPTGFVLSANQFIVVGMRADPEPEIAALHLNGECTITHADADGPVTADFLELQRWMARVTFEESEIGVGQLSKRER
jgi:hypothetical protein